jgi:hypothetical protein
MMPLYARLLKVTLQDPSDKPIMAQVRKKIHEVIAERWTILTNNMPTTVLLSTYLDPRFKSLYFVSDPVRREGLLEKASD